MMYQTGILLTLAGCLSLAGCATPSGVADSERGIAAFKNDARLGAEVKKICFNRNIDGFSNNTRDTVVLSAGVSKDYIVEVRGICRNLDYAQSIGIDATQSCVTRGDYLLVSDSAFSTGAHSAMGPERCMIDKIYAWNKRADDDQNDDAEIAD